MGHVVWTRRTVDIGLDLAQLWRTLPPMQGSQARFPVLPNIFIWYVYFIVYTSIPPIPSTHFIKVLYRYWNYLVSIHEHVIFLILTMYFGVKFFITIIKDTDIFHYIILLPILDTIWGFNLRSRKKFRPCTQLSRAPFNSKIMFWKKLNLSFIF